MKKAILVIITLMMIFTSIGCSAISTPDAAQIKSDLIGNELPGLWGWQFTTLAAFESFTINGKQQQGDTLEYDVTMRLTDVQWDTHILLVDAYITYQKVDGEWELRSITLKSYEEL